MKQTHSNIEETLILSFESPNQRLYALIDLAHPALHSEKVFRWIVGSRAVCLFGDPSPAAQRVSPWLLRIEDSPQGRLRLGRSVEYAQKSSAVSWLTTHLQIEELARRLSVRTEAQLTGQHDILLRHYDSRVLPALNRILRKEQSSAFFALGAAWYFVGRCSSLSRVDLFPTLEVDNFKSPLFIETAQEEALLFAAEAEAVMPESVREEPERFLGLGSGLARYQFTTHWLERARHWRLTTFAHQVILCTLALRLATTSKAKRAGEPPSNRSPEARHLSPRRSRRPLQNPRRPRQPMKFKASINAIVFVASTGCSIDGHAQTGYAPAGAPSRPQESVSLLLQGYNYTDHYIDSHSVDGIGGGNIFESGPESGGSGSTCCVFWRTGTQLPSKIKVRWVADYCMKLVKTKFGNYDDRISIFKEQDAFINEASTDKPRALEVHFYRDGHIEAAVTSGYSPPRLRLPRAENHDRPGVSQEVRKCRDDTK